MTESILSISGCDWVWLAQFPIRLNRDLFFFQYIWASWCLLDKCACVIWLDMTSLLDGGRRSWHIIIIIIIIISYPEWPHRQGGCLACWRLQDRIPAVAELHQFILWMRLSGGTAHEGGGCDPWIGSTVSDAIVCSWLWSTATRSSQLGYFSNYCK